MPRAAMTLPELNAAIEAVSQRYAALYGFERDTNWAILKLTEEVGELTRVHLKQQGQARVSAAESGGLREDFETELADVLGMVLVVAALNGVDLQAAIQRKWLKWHPDAMSAEEYATHR